MPGSMTPLSLSTVFKSIDFATQVSLTLLPFIGTLLHSMWRRVCVMVPCPSVCLSHSPSAAACSGFAAVGPAGRRHRPVAAYLRSSSTGPQHGTQQQMRGVPRL